MRTAFAIAPVCCALACARTGGDGATGELTTGELTTGAASTTADGSSDHGTTTSGGSTAGDESTGAPPAFVPDPSWQRWEVRAHDYEVPAEETTYACFGATLTVDALAQIVAFEPIVDQPSVVHHMIVARSSVPLHVKVPCYPEPPQATMQWGWGPGGTPLVIPEAAGMLIGDEGADVHYTVQIHYNNPLGMSDVVDNSGIALYLTEELRENEAAVWALGEVEDLVIPPGEPSWETVHVCSGASTTALLGEPVHVFGSWLHAHELGRALWTEQRRGDDTIATLGRQDPYTFGDQRFEPLDTTIAAGDALFTHCIYDSTSRTETTVGGGGTENEMCLNYLLYWPRQPFVYYCND